MVLSAMPASSNSHFKEMKAIILPNGPILILKQGEKEGVIPAKRAKIGNEVQSCNVDSIPASDTTRII